MKYKNGTIKLKQHLSKLPSTLQVMRKTLIVSFFLFFLILDNSAQETKADSLILLLNTEKMTDERRLNLYEDLCQYFFVQYDTEKSIEFGEKGLKLAQKEKSNQKISVFYEYLGLAYNDKQEHDTALIYYQKALDKANEAGNKEQELSLYLTLGAYYGQKSNLSIALEYFLKALSIAENLDKKERQALILGNIGSVYTMLDNHNKALIYFEKMLKLSKDIDYHPGIRKSYYELGKTYAVKAHYDEALRYSQGVLDMSRAHNDKTYEALSLQTLAHIYLKKKPADYDLALEYAELSLGICEDLNNSMMMSSALNTMADVYLRQKCYTECEQVSLRSYETDSTNIQINMNILYNLVTSAIFMRNEKKASDYFERYCILKDQYIDKNTHEVLLDMETKYESEKKELRIGALEKEKQLYVWLGISTGIALLLALGVMFYRHRLNTQKVKQLEQEKQLIATQAELDGETTERTRLAQDLHDGLGGMLSVVKLNLKEINTSSESNTLHVDRFDKALDMLDRSMNELRRIAHHMMPESLMRYGLKTAIEDFCHATPSVNFQFFGNDKDIDKRFAVVIYRSTFELVNNALKYAEATIINVQLLIDNGLISLTIQDNGKGFDTDKICAGSGLKNIRARISVYNGKMNICSSPENGTEITIEIENQ